MPWSTEDVVGRGPAGEAGPVSQEAPGPAGRPPPAREWREIQASSGPRIGAQERDIIKQMFLGEEAMKKESSIDYKKKPEQKHKASVDMNNEKDVDQFERERGRGGMAELRKDEWKDAIGFLRLEDFSDRQDTNVI